MTDRVHSLTLILDRDIREDDIESLVQALYHLKHVIQVDKNVSNIESHMAEGRAKWELRRQLVQVMKELTD